MSMNVMPYFGQNMYIRELNNKYSAPVLSLDPFKRACIQEIARLSYKAGIEDERRRIQRMNAKRKFQRKNDDDDSEDDD